MKRAKPEYSDNFPYLLKLLACALNHSVPPQPNADTDWGSVYSMAALHSVAGMVYYAIAKLPSQCRPPEEILEKFQQEYREQLIAEANIQHETETLLRALSDAGVRTLPVKGILLKADYPEPSMRTMTDVDILYDTKKKEQIKDIFRAFGYTLNHEVDDELDFIKKPFHHYELHSQLISYTRPSYSYFADVWSRVTFPDNSCVGRLNVNDTYIYLLEHLAKHLESGGAGIRLVMDVYVFNKAHGSELDAGYLAQELSKLSLNEFSVRIKELAYNWFGGEEPATDTELADFILCSCTFGTSRDSLIQNTIRTENKSGKKQSGWSRILKRLFPSYEYICSRFSSARKLRVLYPFYILAYWCQRLFRYKNINTRNVPYYFSSTDSQDALRLRSVMDTLGLSSRM